MTKQNQHRDSTRPATAVKAGDKTQALPDAISYSAGSPQAEGFYPPARLAQAYVIWQQYGRTFTPAEGLEKGTIFPDLYSPYPY